MKSDAIFFILRRFWRRANLSFSGFFLGASLIANFSTIANFAAADAKHSFFHFNSPHPLDAVTGASGAYSLRLLSSSYTGSAINVRRSSDNTTLDIGFNPDGSLNTTALATFCGTSTCYVTVWYDQSGNAHHATQTTAAYQPTIWKSNAVTAMNGVPAVTFVNASHNYLNLPNTVIVSGTAASTMNAVAVSTSVAGIGTWQWVAAYGNASSRSARAIGRNTNSPNYVDIDIYGYDLTDSAVKVTTPFIATGVFTSATLNLNDNGDSTLSIGDAFNTVATEAYIGMQVNGSFECWNGTISEVILYPSALTQRNRKILEWSQGAYYGITVAPN